VSEPSTFARRIRTARPRARRHGIRDNVVRSLTLRMYPSSARTFALESMVRGPGATPPSAMPKP